MALTSEQFQAISIAERVGGSFSLLGCAFILITHCASASFRRPVNRLIFYASFGSIFSAIASLMSRDGVSRGADSALCLVQAFFIQYWMPADTLWSFCMALNIYLTFYRRYSAEDLRRLEKWYFLLCYGLPLALATALCIINTTERGRIYGPALVDLVFNYRTMAVSPLSVFLWSRVVGFAQSSFAASELIFLSHRVLSIVTFTIYAAVGSNIFQKHQTLQAAIDASPDSRAVKDVRTVTTVDIIRATAGALAVEPATPYSICIETHQSQSGSGIDAQINKNNALRSYMRYSFLFFVAMVITWMSSSLFGFTSITTVYIPSLIDPSQANFGLNLAGALVLSLQGFWNAVIYISTTSAIIKNMWASNVKSRPLLRFPWRTSGRKTCGIPLENMGFDGRSDAGSTSSLAMRPPFESSTMSPNAEFDV
ncbi:hypothetical protein N7532_007199 [Penicillium argentinense]|uniref:G-protein coupled receptors family 2 profile 2 domain-containing protein n=1 Tax=Penicillium argentinense TaxID=1131581 RepID=A0A9W9F783_9EURO|nr:uncharacterized protein N7532_007199 [Penicillium argentinense]KAJ5094908.1 hypothetical protein N7532_007199 [Penicillium argentinense]